MGQGEGDDRQQRVVRDHPHVQRRVRRRRRDARRLLPARPAPGDRRPQRAHLRDRQQRVYRAGFASTQHAYEEAVGPLFETLDWLESCLDSRPYLCGERPTEADWRLFTTLVRFDLVYVGHFKCNVRRIEDYPNLWAYVRRLYAHDGVAETVDPWHIKAHYYQSHKTINPSGIVPVGPAIDFGAG